MRPSSSGIVLVRTTVPGISWSRSMNLAYTDLPMSRFTRRLIGMMVENRIKNRVIETYHSSSSRLSKPSNATRMMESARVNAQSIFVRLLISYSSRPVFDREGDVDKACRVCAPVYTTTASTVAFDARTVFAHAVLSMVSGAVITLSLAPGD